MPENKLERFTPRARKVFALAQEEAEALHHDLVGPEHVLLGILREGGGSAQLLAEMGVIYPQARSLVRDVVEVANSPKLELSADTKKLLEAAVDEARRNQGTKVETGQLLMAMSRLPHSRAYTILKHLSVDTDELYRRAHALPSDDSIPLLDIFAPLAAVSFLNLAESEAEQLRSPSVEPEHILLALLHDPDSAACRLMAELNLSQDRLRGMVQRIRRDLPAQQVAGSGRAVIWSHDALQFLRMYPGYYPDALMLMLVRDWWVLSDLWKQALLEPKQVQSALDRAGIEVTMHYPRHMRSTEYPQVNLSFLFPPPLREKFKQAYRKLRERFSGK
jgi:ATP-dependent Clp protease ATP-binding subunit ClpA